MKSQETCNGATSATYKLRLMLLLTPVCSPHRNNASNHPIQNIKTNNPDAFEPSHSNVMPPAARASASGAQMIVLPEVPPPFPPPL
jgi:hypothetical protein